MPWFFRKSSNQTQSKITKSDSHEIYLINGLG